MVADMNTPSLKNFLLSELGYGAKVEIQEQLSLEHLRFPEEFDLMHGRLSDHIASDRLVDQVLRLTHAFYSKVDRADVRVHAEANSVSIIHNDQGIYSVTITPAGHDNGYIKVRAVRSV